MFLVDSLPRYFTFRLIVRQTLLVYLIARTAIPGWLLYKVFLVDPMFLNEAE